MARDNSGANAISGLEEILGEISPIEDFSGSMSLSFSSPRFEEVKASIEECKDKDMTYAAPAVRHRGVHQQHHWRDQEPDRVHG